MNSHPISGLILRSLVPGEGGMQIDAKKRAHIIEAMQNFAKRNDAGATAAFYGMIGLLSGGNAPKAAASLMGMIVEANANPLPPKPAAGGWAR